MDIQLIQNKIYEIRGQRVMLDFDIAEMYSVETRVLKQAVRRNINRFEGEDFMFEVTKEELSRSQFVTLNKGRGYNIKYLPFAFTELGVAMLSSVLKSDTAIEINRNIMRAFVAIRNVVSAAKEKDVLPALMDRIKALEEVSEETLAAINDLSEDNRKEFDDIYIALTELADKRKQEDKPRRRIGYVQPDE
jgi:hypothetical protein